MDAGVIALLAALAAAALIAVTMRRRDGRFRPVASGPSDDAPVRADAGTPTRATDSPETPEQDVLRVRAEEVGQELGTRLTLLQFSSAFCSPCRATRTLLTQLTQDREDVAHIEVDAESHLGLVRRVGILRTPTVLVLDAGGAVVGRASGVPRREQVLAVLDGAPGSGSPAGRGAPD